PPVIQNQLSAAVTKPLQVWIPGVHRGTVLLVRFESAQIVREVPRAIVPLGIREHEVLHVSGAVVVENASASRLARGEVSPPALDAGQASWIHDAPARRFPS